MKSSFTKNELNDLSINRELDTTEMLALYEKNEMIMMQLISYLYLTKLNNDQNTFIMNMLPSIVREHIIEDFSDNKTLIELGERLSEIINYWFELENIHSSDEKQFVKNINEAFIKSPLQSEFEIEKAINIINQYHPVVVENAFNKLSIKQKECVLSKVNPQDISIFTSEMAYDSIISIISIITSMKIEDNREMIKVAYNDLINNLREEDTLTTNSEKEKLLFNIYKSIKDKKVQTQVLEYLEITNTDLADEIRKTLVNDLVIINSDDKSIQRWLREIDNHDLTILIKYSGNELQQKILFNLSKRLGQMILEDIEFIGDTKMQEVNKNREKLFGIYEKLVDAGEILHPFK